MAGYKVVCDECDAEYELYLEETEDHGMPKHCSYCGAKVPEENITEPPDYSEWTEDDWEKLGEDDEWQWDDTKGDGSRH